MVDPEEKTEVRTVPESLRVGLILDELANELRDAPALSDEAVSRAGIYEDHP